MRLTSRLSQVMAWLRKLPHDTKLPWHRVLNSQRRIAEHPGSLEQYQRLATEGLLPEQNGRFPKARSWPDNDQ